MCAKLSRSKQADLALALPLNPGDGLTAFETRIIGLLASGHDRQQIARALNRSPKTVSNILTVVRDKLGAMTLAQAVALFTST